MTLERAGLSANCIGLAKERTRLEDARLGTFIGCMGRLGDRLMLRDERKGLTEDATGLLTSEECRGLGKAEIDDPARSMENTGPSSADELMGLSVGSTKPSQDRMGVGTRRSAR